MDALKQKLPAQLARQTRYGCDNGHFFAVDTESVAIARTATDK